MDHTLIEEINLLHAQMCQAIADPTRILILYLLADGPRYVTELAEMLDVRQPTVSRHLKVLRDRGLVTATREGTTVHYALRDQRVIQALDLLRASMADILTERAELAEAMTPSELTHPSRLAHTFSIVARDPHTGQMGVAVQSHWFSVGSVVAWAEAGVGAVATQALVEISYGPLGLSLMRAGKSAPEALAALLAADEGRELRQVAMVTREGQVAAHTGARCIADAGHEAGEDFCVQANMMIRPTVWPAMARAYREAQGDLAERMLAALEAGQAAGGDVRGKQSASILIVKPTATGRPWEDVVMDLRVEDHLEPIHELRRLVGLHRAYQHMNRGDDLLGAGQVDQALHEYRAAAQIAPEIEELPFWHAVTLADLGRLDEALPIFRDVFARNRDWAILLPRLPQAGLLRDDPDMMQKILALAP